MLYITFQNLSEQYYSLQSLLKKQDREMMIKKVIHLQNEMNDNNMI